MTESKKLTRVPTAAAESVTPERPGTDRYLGLVVARRNVLRSRKAEDTAIWKARQSGLTLKLIAHALDVNEATVRDRLKRIRRDRARLAAE